MRAIRRAFTRLVGSFVPRADADADLRAEMASHLAMETEENIRRGMDPLAARRAALAAAGGMTQVAERVRDERRLPWIESLTADIRYAVRHFRHAPLATASMVVVLSLGLGTTVLVFTLLNSLATLPAPGIGRDDALVRIRGTLKLQGMSGLHPRLLSWPEAEQYATRTELFTAVAAEARESAAVTIGTAGESSVTTRLTYVSPAWFATLGVRPALGQLPAAGASVTDLAESPSAMISDAMWQRIFGGSTSVVGQVVRINDVAVRVVGVAPPRFLGTEPGDAMTMWLPLAAYPLVQRRSAAMLVSADSSFLTAIARLQADVTPRDATPPAASIAGRLLGAGHRISTSEIPSEEGAPQVESASADVVPLLVSNARVSVRSDMVLSAAAVGGMALLVLLITCTNVSALMVGLASARRREIAVRLSLGAARQRLVRQLLTETVMLTLAAATIGLVVTTAALQLVGERLDIQLVVDWRVTIASCTVAIVTGIVFGLSPALHATRVPVGEVLKGSATAVASHRSRLQRTLVVAQVAFTQPLLVGLGVVVVTLSSDAASRGRTAAADRIVEVELDSWVGNRPPAEQAARVAAAVERVAALPGVVAALPMELGTVSAPLAVHPGDRIANVGATPMQAHLTAAPSGYFRAFDIPVIRGRDFAQGEYSHTAAEALRPQAHDVVIIASDLARRLWGDANPIGRRLVMGLANPATAGTMVVVGVVDAAAAGPSEVNRTTRVYVPYASMNSGVIARTAGVAAPLLGTIRRAVVAAAPGMPVVRAQTVAQRQQVVRRDAQRISAAVASGGLVALLLSAVGLYAVVALAVGQRTREIGIRTALGAERGRVVRMFFRQGVVLGALGLVLGLPLSLVAVRVIGDMLHIPMAGSPLVGTGVGALVLAVASIAAWLPARRASTIDPLVALRSE